MFDENGEGTLLKVVTTTSQATTALRILRENKNKFDLVISDVHMPDMDGFKLLELVGLEMDLPVIMLSANGDPKLVMKGITHGACYYLLKPVRIEELKTIWQHLIRRKKSDNKDRNSLDNRDKPDQVPDQKLDKKRKDQNGDEDEDPDEDEDENENEDPTTQKKPRVVWSVELHRKFVAAVNILGIDYIPELPTHPGDTASFPVSSGSTDLKIIAGSSNSCFVGVSNKHLMLEEHGQGLQDGQKFGKQSSLSAGSLNPRYSSNFPDHGRCNDNWSNAVQSNGVQSNSLTLNDCFKRSILHPSGIRESMSTMALQSRNNPCDVSSISTLPIHLQDSKADLPCQVGVATVSSNAGQLINNGPLGWDDHRQDDPYHSNGLSNSINSAIPINGNGNPNGCNLDANSLFFQRTTSFSSTGLSNFVDTSLMKHNEAECSAMETLVRSRDGYFPSQEKPQDGSVLNNFGSLDDLVSVMVNQEQGEFGCGGDMHIKI